MLTAGHILRLCVISLLGLATIMVNSAAMTVDSRPITVGSLLLGRPTIYALLAIGVMCVVGGLDIRRLASAKGLLNPIVLLLGLSTALCTLALIPGWGATINGSSRWLFLGPRSWGLTFQPSELAKWTAVLAMAWWCARHAGVMSRLRYGLVPPLAVLALLCGLIIIEDLGTAVLIGTVGGLMLIAAGARIWQVAMLVPPALAAVAVMIWQSPYRVKRLLAFLDPFADPQGIGYHAIQSMAAIAGGNRGLGNGIQKQGYLPADTTDFLFAVICEEMGIAGAGLVIALYLAIIWAALLVIRECRHSFGRLLGFGVLCTIGLQAAMNIAVVTVVVPTKGIALPLLSSGGTGWVMGAAAIGLIVAIDRLNCLERQWDQTLPRTGADAPPVELPRQAGPKQAA
jgi:cell division protein FtsW